MVGRCTVGRGTGFRIHLLLFRNLHNFVHPTFIWLFLSHVYAREVKNSTQENGKTTFRGLSAPHSVDNLDLLAHYASQSRPLNSIYLPISTFILTIPPNLDLYTHYTSQSRPLYSLYLPISTFILTIPLNLDLYTHYTSQSRSLNSLYPPISTSNSLYLPISTSKLTIPPNLDL